MDLIAKRSLQKKKDVEICRHYWLIEFSNQPTSRGICKFCGCEREFINSFETLRSAAFAGRKSGEKYKLTEIQVG